MLHLVHSLRVRLVVTFVAVVGIISALLGLGGVALREWQLRSRFDHQLLNHSRTATAWVHRELAAHGLNSTHQWMNPPPSPLSGELYLQLSTADGEVLARSRNLGGVRLPAAPTPRTVPGALLHDMPAPPRSLRVVSQPIPGHSDQRLTLHVAQSFDDVADSLAFLQGLFWIVTAASLLVAALAAWIVTGRATGRLDELSQLARHITPQHLNERVAVSPKDDEISRLADEVNHMLGRLESSFKAQERFITNASHELQTPVAVLLSEAQLLKAAQPPPSADHYQAFVRSVEQEMRQLTRMIGSLLSLIRMESGELQRAETLVSLNDVLVTAVEDARSLAEHQHAAVRLTLPDPDQSPAADADAPPHREPLVVGDPGLLQIMVENLVRNAIRNSPPGEPVSISLDLDLDHAVITVSDRGSPLSDQGIQSAFDRSRIARPDGDGRQGSGLELSIARTIADLHGGAIGVRNRDAPTPGAAFFIWLPLSPTATP